MTDPEDIRADDLPIVVHAEMNDVDVHDMTNFMVGLEARLMEAVFLTSVELFQQQAYLATSFNRVGPLSDVGQREFEEFLNINVWKFSAQTVGFVFRSVAYGMAEDQMEKLSHEIVESVRLTRKLPASLVEQYDRSRLEEYLRRPQRDAQYVPTFRVTQITGGSIYLYLAGATVLIGALPHLYAFIPVEVRETFTKYVSSCFSETIGIVQRGAGKLRGPTLGEVTDSFEQLVRETKFTELEIKVGNITIKGKSERQSSEKNDASSETGEMA